MLGIIAYLSDSSERISVSIDGLALLRSGFQEGHYMNWALCRVLPIRAGANQHRYQFDDEIGEVDFCFGDIEEFGVGRSCQDIGSVEVDDRIHFVGQITRRLRGIISIAQIFVSCSKIKILEWTLILAIEE
jgi:hypothetical protein